jgi:hypothetical protein
MAPTAVTLPPDPIAVPLKAQLHHQSNFEQQAALVIGSLATAQNGKYQNVISDLAEGGRGADNVERQLLDRILDGGMHLISGELHCTPNKRG